MFGVVLPWSSATVVLNKLGAESIPNDPMLNYWLRMASGAFTGVGIFFLAVALRPDKFTNVIGIVAILMFAEGLVLLFYGLKLNLSPFPFYCDSIFCLIAGTGIWLLRHDVELKRQQPQIRSALSQ